MTTATAAQPKMTPWWLVLLEGIALILVGLFLLSDPGITVVVLVQVLAIYWLIKGIFDIVSIFINHTAWGWRLFSGVLGIIAGIVILQHPFWSPIVVGNVLVIMVAILGMLMGGLGVINAFQGAGWGTGLLGVVSIFFGIYLLLNNNAATLALPWTLGILGIAGGIIAIFLAFRVRKVQKT